MNDDFYIGYEASMPRSLAGRTRIAALALVALALILSGVLVLAQARFARATFEFGRTRTFDGRLIEFPYPALLVSEPPGGLHVYWLVGPGKHGAADIVSGRDGLMVRVSGSLIERDGDRMIELSAHDALTATGSSAASFEPLRSLGPVVVRGEVVDSKCHLGVMKPGEGPTHRDCAVRCLLGRVTPMLAPRGGQTGLGRLPLVDREGRPMSESLEAIVGRPVEIRGELLARGPLRFLAADLSAVVAAP